VRLALVLAALAVLAGCSHGPKPSADSGAAPVEKPRRTSSRTTHRKETARATPPAPKPAPPPPAAPEPNAGVVTGSSTSAPPDTASARKEVVPQLSDEERRDLDKKSRESIEAARTKLSGLDAGKLDAEKQRKLLIAQGFLADAIAARNQQDWMRASQLATKAKLLADEIAPN